MSTQQIKIVAIDDEKKSRELIKEYLKEETDFELVSVESNATDGISAILSHKPDMVLLDIEMDNGDGIFVSDKIHQYNLSPQYIFITSAKDRILDAINAQPIASIIKPFKKEELIEKLLAFKEKIISESPPLGENEPLNVSLCYNTRQGNVFVNMASVFYIQGDGNYSTVVFTDSKKTMLSINIKKTIEPLHPKYFYRINKGVTVNLKYINTFSKDTRNCILKEGNMEETFLVSKYKLKSFEEHLLKYKLL